MAFQFEFNAPHQILRIRFDGTVSDEELARFYRLAVIQAARTGAKAAIIDFSAVTDFRVTTETMRNLANSPPAMPDPNLPRFVVAPDLLIFGLSRLFEMQGAQTRPNFYVLRNAEEIWTILAIPEPCFEPLATDPE